MHPNPLQYKPLRPLSPLLLSLVLGCADLSEEQPPSESHATTARGLALPPGLAPSLVKDIQVGTAPGHYSPGSWLWGSDPAATRSEVYFKAYSPSVGEELWKTDGTEAGTQLVRDISPGLTHTSILELAAADEAVYLTAYDHGGIGNSLWKSDGTASGTFKIRSSDGDVKGAQTLVTCGDRLFYTLMNPMGGSQLWRSDGTPEGTLLLTSSVRFDYYMPGHTPLPFICAQGTLFFVGGGADWSSELWKSDGTAQGTQRVEAIGPIYSTPMGGGPLLTTDGSRVFINTADFPHPLWTSDGTPEGTRPLGNVDLMKWPAMIGARDGHLFFSTFDYASGFALWTSDGTTEGTRQVKQLTSGPPGFLLTALLLGDTLLLSEGPSLYKSDGTAEGTVLLHDNVGLDSDFMTRRGEGAALPNGRLVFSAREGYGDVRLWVSDGSRAGTTALQTSSGQIPWRASGIRRVGGRVVFWADDGIHGTEPWVTDGTPEGTRMARDIFRVDSSDPLYFTDVDGTLFFSAYDAQNHQALWKSDGTAEGTVLVKALDPVTWNMPQQLTRVGPTLFFFFSTPSGFSLWKSDGTAEGTVQVRPLGSGVASHLTRATALGSTLFFNLHDATTGMELWKSDGTAEGTVLVKDLNPGTASSAPEKLMAMGDVLFFIANDGVHGAELWKTDGTAEGTVLVGDLIPGAGSPFPETHPFWSRPACLYGAGDTLYLAADDGVHGTEPWKSDGTAEGTVLLRDVMPGAAGSGVNLGSFVPVGPHGAVAFAASNGVQGMELWMSDGTPEGTRMLADVAEGALSASPAQLTVSGPRLFFVADEGVHGRELWSVKQAAFQSR
jgi:ELWxxDGT repeat protein